MIGPVAVGLNKFVFEAAAPDIHKLPSHEWLGTTIVLLQCSYRDQVFFRVGYFVKNDYTGEQLIEHPDSIQARETRFRKTSEKIRTALDNGEGWADFEDYIRERERERKLEAEGKMEEEAEDDEEKSSDSEEEPEQDDMIVDDEEAEEDAEDDNEGEEDDEDEEDEESDDERGPPAGKRPPAGKQPPASAVPASTNASEAISTNNEASSASNAPASDAAEEPLSNAPNPKKRAREESSANGELIKNGESHENGKEDEPTAKRRKLTEWLDDYVSHHYEEGPRWYTNLNPALIRRTVIMDGPRVTLFTISWADDDM